MKELLRFIMATLVTFRLVELVTFEYGPFHILERFRQAIGVKVVADYDENGRVIPDSEEEFASNQLAEMVLCPRCLSVWVGMGISVILWWFVPVYLWEVLVRGVAFSGAAVVLGILTKGPRWRMEDD